MGRTSFDFTDSVVLGTGGGTGIGEAIARGFLDAGATVVVTGRRLEPLEQALTGYPAERTLAWSPISARDSRCATSSRRWCSSSGAWMSW